MSLTVGPKQRVNFSSGEQPPKSNEIASAIQKFSNGLINRCYVDDHGHIQTIQSSNDVTRLISSGFILRAVEGKFYLTRGLLGGSPGEKFSSTEALAQKLKSTDLNDANYPPLQELAIVVIDLFAKRPTKTKPLIDEVTNLASANNTVITRALLKVLVKEINEGVLLDTDLLKALRSTLINSSIEALDADDLVQVLKITMRRITEIHNQDKTSSKLSTALSTISDILDVMGDANVIKVGRINLHDPLYKILDSLSDDADLLVASQAAYAKQALVRMPNDESKSRSFFRRTGAAVKGFASLSQVMTKQDLQSISEAYDNFKEALSFQVGKKEWYGDIRILKLLSEKKHYELFKSIMDTRIKEGKNPHVVGNILFLLHEAAPVAQKWALECMADLFLDDKWGDKKKVKKIILNELLFCATVPAISGIAKEVLSSIGDKCKSKEQQKLFDALVDFDEIKEQPVHHVEEPSTALITEAQKGNQLTLVQKLEQLRESALTNEEISKELASYIPVLGSRCLFDPKEQASGLEEMVEQFLQGADKVFLLIGDSGGGKSTYLRHLERRLWKEWTPEKPIPLFISLPALKLPFRGAISESLGERGFSKAEQEELKTKHSFIFLLDGYDELKQKRNLYEGNQLQHWNAKTIITCRTQHLSGEQSSYRNYFTPPSSSLISAARLDEASTSPFILQQIEAYCKKFIQQHNIPRTWEQYEADFNRIPDLSDIIQTPFLLRIIAEVLPAILGAHSQGDIKLLRIEIFDAFVNNWFNREERRIQRMETDIDIPDLKKAFAAFARKLALEMVEDEIVSVDYEPSSDPFNSTSSKWEKYFSSDSKMTLIRSGVPLRKIGPHSYAFIHKSLLEYFSGRAIINRETGDAKLSISFDNLNRKILSREPEIIRLLAECLTEDPKLESTLFEIIERSKQDEDAAVAASNAITILNAANINLSRRDFRGIRIPEADLSQAIITATDLSHADLRKVRLDRSILDYSTIAFSDTDGLELGQKPFQQIGLHNCLAFSVNRQRVITGSHNGTIRIGNCQTGKEICSFKGHEKSVDSIAFSPDGTRALSGSADKTVKLWDCTTEKEIYCFSGHEKDVRSVAFSPDGRRALSGSSDKTVRLWDCETGKEVFCFKGHEDGVPQVAFSPNGSSVLSGSYDTTIQLWDCQTGKEIFCFKGHKDCISSMAFSPDGTKALVGYFGNAICLWDCKTGKQVYSFIGHSDSVTSVAFSPDGRRALTGSHDKTVLLWDCETGKNIYCFKGHHGHVTSVAFAPDGKWAFSTCGMGTLRIWNLDIVAAQRSQKANIISEDNGLIEIRSTLDQINTTVQLWDFATGKEISRIKVQGSPQSVNVSADCTRALVSCISGISSLRDCKTGKEICCFEEPCHEPETVAFSSDGKWIIWSQRSQILELFDCITGKKIYDFKGHEEHVSCVAFSPDGTKVISGSYDKTVRLWDCTTGKEIYCFTGHGSEVGSVAFSPDGTKAISGSHDQTVRLWDCATGKEIYCFKGHKRGITSVTFSPNGKWILSGSAAGTVRLWNWKTEKEIHCFNVGPFVDKVQFLSDGKRISIFQNRITCQIWELFDENGDFNPALQMNLGGSYFSAQQLDINGVKEMSEPNQKVLLQHGAKDMNSTPETVEERPFEAF